MAIAALTPELRAHLAIQKERTLAQQKLIKGEQADKQAGLSTAQIVQNTNQRAIGTPVANINTMTDPQNHTADFAIMDNYNQRTYGTEPTAPKTSTPVVQSAPLYKAPTPVVQQQPQYDIQGQMEKLKAAQLQASIAGLDKQKNGALSNLSAEQKTIQPMAYADRNKANIDMNNQNRAWKEYIANKYGSSKAGVEDIGFMKNQNIYSGNVGSINRDATNKESDILRRTTDVNNNYLSDIEAARAGIETNYLNNLINQMNTDRSFNRSTFESDRGFNRNVLESDRGFNYQTGQDTIQNNAQYAGTYNGQLTQQAQMNQVNIANQQLQNKMAQIGLDTAKLNFEQLPQQIKDQATLLTQQIENGKLSLQQGKYELEQLTDPESFTNKMKKFQLDTASFNYGQLSVEAKQKADQVAQSLSIGNITRQQAQMELNDMQNPNSLYNLTKNAQYQDLTNKLKASQPNSQEQINYYTQLRDTYLNSSTYKGYPAKAYEWITSPSGEQANKELLGDNLYNRMVQEIGSLAAPTDTTEVEKAVMSLIKDSYSKDGAARYIAYSNLPREVKEQLIFKYGLEAEMDKLAGGN